MTLIRRTAVASALLIYALIVLGALVRATNSGLSCPDWPTCYGRWVLTPADFGALPYTGYTYGQVMLEWVHRLIAGVFVGPLVLLLVALAWAQRRQRAILLKGAAVLLVLLLVQGALGGITVLDRNSPWSVAVHLGTALLVLTTVLWLIVRSRPLTVPATTPPAVIRLAWLAWGTALLAMLSAAITAKSGASLACSTWPLCDGAVIPPLDDPLKRIHFLHRLLAGLFTLAVAALAMRAVRSDVPAAVRRLALLALALALVQVLLGAMVVLTAIHLHVAVLHQALGVLTFAIVTILLWTGTTQTRNATASSGTGATDGLVLQGAGGPVQAHLGHRGRAVDPALGHGRGDAEAGDGVAWRPARHAEAGGA